MLGELKTLREELLKCYIAPDTLNVAMVLGNAEAIGMAVEEGLGIVFIFHLTARGLDLGQIVEVSVEGMELTRNTYLAHNRRLSLTCAGKLTRNFQPSLGDWHSLSRPPMTFSNRSQPKSVTLFRNK